jgi:hypothetical protein
VETEICWLKKINAAESKLLRGQLEVIGGWRLLDNEGLNDFY